MCVCLCLCLSVCLSLCLWPRHMAEYLKGSCICPGGFVLVWWAPVHCLPEPSVFVLVDRDILRALTFGVADQTLRGLIIPVQYWNETDTFWDATLTGVGCRFIACLAHHNFAFIDWCATEQKRRKQGEEISLCASFVCSKTQIQSAEPRCSGSFVFCKEQVTGGCCYCFIQFDVNVIKNLCLYYCTTHTHSHTHTLSALSTPHTLLKRMLLQCLIK